MPHAALVGLPREEGTQVARLRNGSRQPDAYVSRRQCREPRKRKRQEVAALGRGERMEFIDDDGLQRPQQMP